MQVGDRLTSGDIYAKVVHENSLLDHRLCVPPGARGNVTFIAPAGEYSLTDKVLELEFGGSKKVRAPPWNPKAHHLRLWGLRLLQGLIQGKLRVPVVAPCYPGQTRLLGMPATWANLTDNNLHVVSSTRTNAGLRTRGYRFLLGPGRACHGPWAEHTEEPTARATAGGQQADDPRRRAHVAQNPKALCRGPRARRSTRCCRCGRCARRARSRRSCSPTRPC